MKNICLVFLLICSVAFTRGTSFGAEPKAAFEHSFAAEVSKQSQALSRASTTKANRRNQFPNSNRKPSTAGNPMNLRGSNSGKHSAVANDRLIQNETVSNVVLARSPNILRPSVELPSDVRHRGDNPAVIRGSANSRTGNTGAINGTRMKRKH